MYDFLFILNFIMPMVWLKKLVYVALEFCFVLDLFGDLVNWN